MVIGYTGNYGVLFVPKLSIILSEVFSANLPKITFLFSPEWDAEI